MVARPDLRPGRGVSYSENSDLIPDYFTATPVGWLRVVNGACGVSPPVACVMAYCETLAELKLATKIQLPSARIAIEFGPEFVATGVPIVVNAPSDGLIRNPETWFDPRSTTYTYFANGSMAMGPGESPAA